MQLILEVVLPAPTQRLEHGIPRILKLLNYSQNLAGSDISPRLHSMHEVSDSIIGLSLCVKLRLAGVTLSLSLVVECLQEGTGALFISINNFYIAFGFIKPLDCPAPVLTRVGYPCKFVFACFSLLPNLDGLINTCACYELSTRGKTNAGDVVVVRIYGNFFSCRQIQDPYFMGI